jgi:hypothetical protein
MACAVTERPDISPGAAQQGPTFAVQQLPEEVKNRLRAESCVCEGDTMTNDCAAPLEKLRYLTITHWTFSGTEETGHLVVRDSIDREFVEFIRSRNDAAQEAGETYTGLPGRYDGLTEAIPVAQAIVEVFRYLHEQRFPIEQVRLHSFYEDDAASMLDNNTSAFRCDRRRTIEGTSLGTIRSWYVHSFGLAIDINPVQNPAVYVDHANVRIDPPNGSEYVSPTYLGETRAERAARAFLGEVEGVIVPGGIVDQAFGRAFPGHSWYPGYNWRSFTDYQHYSFNDW